MKHNNTNNNDDKCLVGYFRKFKILLDHTKFRVLIIMTCTINVVFQQYNCNLYTFPDNIIKHDEYGSAYERNEQTTTIHPTFIQ